MSDTTSELSDFSVELSHKFANAFSEAGGTPAYLNDLAEDPQAMRRLVGYCRGANEFKPKGYELDLSEDPLFNLGDKGFSIREHLRIDSGSVVMRDQSLHIDGQKVGLFWAPEQEEPRGGSIDGHALYRTWKSKKGLQTLNASLCDFLYDHPELIPKKWKKLAGAVYFLGTVFEDADDALFVEGLKWSHTNMGLYRTHKYLTKDFRNREPAVVLE